MKNLMAKRGSYLKAILKAFENKNGCTSKEIYETVDKELTEKGKWWRKTVRNILNRKSQFEKRNEKWFLNK